MANPQKENGYIPIATEIWDHLCAVRIPGEVRQIVDTIIRKTYGYNKKEDFISNSQFCEITGQKKGNVVRSLSKAITHDLVIKSDNGLMFNKDWEKWIPFEKVIRSDNTVIRSDNNKKVIRSDNTVIRSDNKKLSEVSTTINNIDNITINNRSPKKLKVIRSDNTPVNPDLFKKFWDSYPRKVAKLDAIKAFNKLNPNEQLIDIIIQKLTSFKETDWKDQDPKYIPHPSAWLNGRRWEDELGVSKQSADVKKKTKPTIDEELKKKGL